MNICIYAVLFVMFVETYWHKIRGFGIGIKIFSGAIKGRYELTFKKIYITSSKL